MGAALDYHFPLFDWNADEKRWDPVNHPFTAPREEDLHMLEANRGAVLAKAYDVILNGWELGGGSIRIHDRDTQATVPVQGFAPGTVPCTECHRGNNACLYRP